jgi:hypothetical protein
MHFVKSLDMVHIPAAQSEEHVPVKIGLKQALGAGPAINFPGVHLMHCYISPAIEQ